MFGKWAGGYEGSPSTPDKRGIDEFYGYICQFQAHLYFPNFLNRFSRSMGDTCVVREVLEQNILHEMYGDDYANRQQYSADLIHQRALEWLRQQEKDKPFLGIFTYTLPHAELRQPDDSLLQAFRGKLLPERAYRGRQASRHGTETRSENLRRPHRQPTLPRHAAAKRIMIAAQSKWKWKSSFAPFTLVKMPL